MAEASSPILDGEPVEPTVVEAFAKKRKKLCEVLSYATGGITFLAWVIGVYASTKDDSGHGRVAALDNLPWLQYVVPFGIVGFVLAMRGYKQYGSMHSAAQQSGARCRLIGQRLFVIQDATPTAPLSYRLMKRDIAKVMTPLVPSARAKVVERGGQ